MRLDKFLKVSRLIKRRTVANEACDAGRVLVNGKTAKASLISKLDFKNIAILYVKACLGSLAIHKNTTGIAGFIRYGAALDQA